MRSLKFSEFEFLRHLVSTSPVVIGMILRKEEIMFCAVLAEETVGPVSSAFCIFVVVQMMIESSDLHSSAIWHSDARR